MTAPRRGSIKRTCPVCAKIFPITPSRANSKCSCSRACAVVLRVALGLHIHVKHGEAGNARRGVRPSIEYRAYHAMLTRCYNQKCRKFHLWGGRGITVCDRWRESYTNFLADMGRRPPGTSLDRIDGERGYGPDNCRWADICTQNRNRRGVRTELREAARQ